MNLKHFKERVLNLFPSINSEILRIRWAQKQLTVISRGESIIDVGAGEVLFKQYCAHLRYTSQDLGLYTGSGDSKGLQTGTWDGSKVDIVFDNALCTAVLEHVPYPDLAIKEIGRILKKRGKLILDAPFCSQTHLSPYFFATGFSSNWYKLILSKYGFKIIKMIPYGNYFDYLSLELLRFPLVAKRYSVLGIMGFLLYLFTIPLTVITGIVSRLSGGSEKQLCFGYHILATKI